MTGQLNTTVNGSTGTCDEGAEWLGAFSRAAAASSDSIAATRRADDAWHGPASDAYHRSMADVGTTCDDLDYTARQYQRALLEFSAALNKVIERMVDARMKAFGAQLEMKGPFILPPKPVGPGPEPVSGTMTPGEFNDAMADFREAAEAHAAVVAEYNRKAEAFNRCSEIVQEARNREDEAHANLRQALSIPEDAKINGVELGLETVGAALAFIETAENERYDALRNAKLHATETRTFQQLAMGTLTTLNAKQAAQLRVAGEKAGLGSAHYLQRAEQFGRYVKGVPKAVRTWTAGYPGKGAVGPNSPMYKRAAGSVAKRLPYVGSLLVVGNEAWNAYKGEQTWEKALARTGGQLAAAGAGAKAGAIAGGRLGAGGMVIGTLVGGVVGGIGGQEVIDIIDPQEEPYPQPKAETMPDYRVDKADAVDDIRLLPPDSGDLKHGGGG